MFSFSEPTKKEKPGSRFGGSFFKKESSIADVSRSITNISSDVIAKSKHGVSAIFQNAKGFVIKIFRALKSIF